MRREYEVQMARMRAQNGIPSTHQSDAQGGPPSQG